MTLLSACSKEPQHLQVSLECRQLQARGSWMRTHPEKDVPQSCIMAYADCHPRGVHWGETRLCSVPPPHFSQSQHISGNSLS